MKRLLALACFAWCTCAVGAGTQPSPAPGIQPDSGASKESGATAPGAAPTQAPEIPARLRPQVLVSVSPNQGLAVGDPITLKIEAIVEREIQISVPEQSFAPLELHARRSRVDDAAGKQRFVFELELLALEPGSLTIPALSLRVVADDGALAEVKTEPQTIEVKSLIANEPNAAPKAPTKPVVVMQDNYTLAWIGGGVLAVLAVAGLTVLLQRWLAKRPKALPPPPPAVPPWDLALQRLAELDARKTALFAEERGEEFVDGVSDVLRQYLGHRFGFEGLESTSDEILSTLERLRPPKLSLSGVALLLEQCDLVKFARMQPDLAQCDDLWNGAVGLIRATTPPPGASGGAQVMKRALAPFGFCLVVFVPALYAVATILTDYYEVPLSPHALRFARPWAGLLGLGALAVIFARGYWDQVRSPRVRVSRGFDLAMLPVSPRVRLRPLLYALRVTVLLLCTLALMGPQSIHARDRTELEGIDIVLTLNLSLSMQAADITPNRFVATQAVVDEFIARRPNDRIGAVVFGRDAYTLMPLTTDKDMLRGAIADLELGMIEGRGTAIGNAVGVSLDRLRNSHAKSKVMILLTDGDSNSGNISPDEAAAFAKHMGVKLYAILMGRTDDAPVQRGLDLFGRPLLGGGNFPVNPELLKRMSQRTGGEFFLASDRKGLERSFHTILNHLEKSEVEDAGAVFGELFAAFVGPAVLLLILEALLGTLVFRRFP